MKATAGIEDRMDGVRCEGAQCIDGWPSVDLSRLTGRARFLTGLAASTLSRTAAPMKKPAGRLALAGG
ncbi:TPA: hypothetical protein ACYLN4_009095, partial [Burkholderia lata]